MTELKFQSIGYIDSEFTNPKDLVFACKKGLTTDTDSKIIINKEFQDGLKGLENFSHIFVMYFLHKATRLELTTNPGLPNDDTLGQKGVFATRSQYRPNHIALRLVRVVKVEGNVVYVKGLDAIQDSLVLDIKPYVKGFDRPKEFNTADWYNWIDEE